MTYRPAHPLPLLAVAAAAAAWPCALEAQDGPAGALEAAGSPLAAELDRAREELDTGRHWHAAELLEEMGSLGALSPEGLLLLARARAGFRDWAGVLAIIQEAPWVDSLAPLEGALLEARAQEALGNWPQAAEGYRRATERSPDAGLPVRARLARAQLKAGKASRGMEILDQLAAGTGSSLLSSALAWEMARWALQEGDTALVGGLVARITARELQDRSRDYYARGVLASGDSVRAELLYRSLLASEDGGNLPGWRERVATLTLARGDTAEAYTLFRQTLLESGRTRAGMESARRLVRMGELDRELSLDAARALDRLGDGAGALLAYDRHLELSLREGLDPDPRARVERARIAATVPARVGEAVLELRALSTHPDPAVGVRALEVWTALRRRQGQTGNVRTLREWLVERYPDSDEAAEVVFLRGDVAEDLRDWEGALAHYREVTAMAPRRSMAGRARMRVGQIQLQVGDPSAALETYQGYLAEFPDGRRWVEASFWAGRILVEMGDTAAASEVLERILTDDPFSYYAAEASALLGRPFPPTLSAPPAQEDAGWVQEALERLDLLDEAGLDEAAAVHVEVMVARADAEGPAAQYPLAEGLIVRGRTIEGINRGWALLRDGQAWNPRLVRILYPFPARAMVEREAEEYGLDPIFMASLIRQESAWDRDIVSPAGAIGLMQVMPPTGREIAAAIGPDGFTPESLESAEVNLHLGGRFLRDMLDRFGPDLPLVLSAYNAGPTRAARWRNLPEASDRHRLTERIPIEETRGYVRNVTRNLAIYRALYGAAKPSPVTQ